MQQSFLPCIVRAFLILITFISVSSAVFPSKVFAQPVFTLLSPQNAILGEVYGGYIFRATGATSYSLAPTSRALPSGFALARNGTLNGTPTQIGTFSGIVIRATGPSGFADSRPITIIVIPATAPTAFQTPATLITTAATATALFFGLANGFPAPQFSLAPGSAALPDGLRLENNQIIGLTRQGGVVENIVIRASNAAGFVDSRPITLRIEGQSQALGFASLNPSFVFREGFNGGVSSVALQNGFYVVGGDFNQFDGRRVPHLIRISPQGRLDNTFSPRKADGTPLLINYIRKVKVLPDDKILIAGSFADIYDEDENELYGEFVLRLLPEGMLDPTYVPAQLDFAEIYDILPLPDGRVWVATENGTITELDRDGVLENAILAAPSAGIIYGLKLLRSGRVLAYTEQGALIRYLPNGRVDAQFRSGLQSPEGMEIWDITELPNGNLFVCGTIPYYFFDPIASCAVLAPDGRQILAPSHFEPFFAARDEFDSDVLIPKNDIGGVRTALPLADGRVLVALHTTSRGFLLYRLNADFSLDTNFTPRNGLSLDYNYNTVRNNIQGMFFDSEQNACLFGNIVGYDGFRQIGMVRINTTAQLNRFGEQTPPPIAAVGAAYEPFRFRANAEPAPFFTLAKHSAPLPDGMTLSTSGVLSGTPTTTGIFSNIIVRAATGFVEQTFSTAFTLTVLPAQMPMRFTSATPPIGLRGVTFATYQLQADGAPAPTFALAPNSPRMPRGMTLSTNGIIAGLPAVQGLTSLIVRASNRFGFVDAVIALRIDAPTPPEIFRNTGNPTAQVGSLLMYPLNASGSQPLTYSLTNAALPQGLTLSTNGVITGVPERSGTFTNIRIFAENPAGDASTTLTITVLPRDQRGVAGSFDTSFARTSRPNAAINTIVRLANGSFIIGGEFTTLGNAAVNRLARLTSSGALDTTFNEASFGTAFYGANAPVQALAVQSDGSILVGGRFTQINGINRRSIARLNSDGTLDNTFQIGTGFSHATQIPEVRTIAVQTDGRIIVGGNFTSYNGRSCNSLIRLNVDGTLDADFHLSGLRGVDAAVNVVRLQANGRILVGGAFTSFLMPSFAIQRGILRLMPDGALDTSFRTQYGVAGGSSTVYDIAPQTSNTMLVAGSFGFYDSRVVNHLAQISNQGGVELGSNTLLNGATAPMLSSGLAFPSVLVQRSNGFAFMLGNFRRFNNVMRNGFIPLQANGQPDEAFPQTFGFQNNTSGAFSGYPLAAVMDRNDDAMIVVGGFAQYDGSPQQGIVRILLGNAANTTSQSLAQASIPFNKDQAALTSNHALLQRSSRSGTISHHTFGHPNTVEVSPNPFSDATVLRVKMEQQGSIRFTLHDALGRDVTTLAEGIFSEGEHLFRLESAQLQASGVYRWRLQTASGIVSGTIAFVR